MCEREIEREKKKERERREKRRRGKGENLIEGRFMKKIPSQTSRIRDE